MAEPHVRTENSFAIDALGIRRFVRAGDQLWPGWTWADEPEAAEPVAAGKKPSAPPKPAERAAPAPRKK